MGQYQDDQALRIERENESVLHVLLTPVRMAIELVKWMGILVLVGILFVVNQVGFVVDLGDRSQRARDSHSNYLEQQRGSRVSIFDVDFTTQPNPTDKSLDRANRFWDNGEPFSQMDQEPENGKTKAFTTTRTGGLNPDEGIPYCIAVMHRGRMSQFFNSEPGSWSTRNDDALDRKSARMQRDYESAAMMTAALRSTPAHMKLNRIRLSKALCWGV